MNRRGVLYDTGRHLGFSWRPVFDREATRRDLTVIRDELHCNAVKLCGRDLNRLAAAAEDALDLGLEVWLSPELWNHTPERTLAYLAEAARIAEAVRAASAPRVAGTPRPASAPHAASAPRPAGTPRPASAPHAASALGLAESDPAAKAPRRHAHTADPDRQHTRTTQGTAEPDHAAAKTPRQHAHTPEPDHAAKTPGQDTRTAQRTVEPDHAAETPRQHADTTEPEPHDAASAAGGPDHDPLAAGPRGITEPAARVVLSVATEATFFLRGILPGRTFAARTRNPAPAIRAGRHTDALAQFLAAAARTARREFAGPLTYASLPFERVDWSLFDFVGVDHYRYAGSEDHYDRVLERLLRHGKPVVVTEFGMRTYRGADQDPKLLSGGLVNWPSVAVNQMPVTRRLRDVPVAGRLFRARLRGGEHVRDEALQARRVAEDLAILERAGVDGAFVTQFAEPMLPYDPDPRFDLDMSGFGLVRTTTGPWAKHQSWERKASFHAVAEHFGKG